MIRERIPIKRNTDGIILVGGTRVPLDTIVSHFKHGALAEEIAKWYPTLELAVEGKMKVMQAQYVFDAKGKKTGVILSLERYEQLLEDLHELAVVAERRDEKLISLDEMKRRLKQDGIL